MDNTSPPAAIVGLAWYLEVDFEEIKRTMADGQTAYTTFEDWLQSARMSEHHQQRAGHRVIRATIRPQPFLTWCSARNVSPDAAARKLFAQTYAQEAAARGE